ncbi:MAG: hypothetical protein DRZ79_00840 [Candidatus Cloacimonadota bacterium]|nr:MAG: hypothetical protein DRZ79_00840 [Candidatus Cloacimonadota bacterium]
MAEEKFDVVVVGAGPAGSVAARFAAENGASVLMLEREREPGIPVRCAEGVSHAGIAPFIEIDKRWIASTINVARLFSPNGEHAYMYNNGTGYVLERRLFDAALCEIACKKGAELRLRADAIDLVWENDQICGVKYRHRGEIKTVYCDIVIGADGVESRVGRWAGMKTAVMLEDIDTCYQYTLTNIDLQGDSVDFYFGNQISPGGYIWVFPKSQNTANVGIGISGHLAKNNPPKKLLDEFIGKHFPNAKKTYEVCGGVPTANTLKEIFRDRIMLVGDAARQVNPVTGGGIVQGMIAGSIAGKVAADAVKEKRFDKKFLKKYKKEWDKRLGHLQNLHYALKNKFFQLTDEKFNNIVEICKSIPPEKFTLKELFSSAVKGDPKLVAEIAKAFVVSKFK